MDPLSRSLWSRPFLTDTNLASTLVSSEAQVVAEASERGLLWDRGLTYKGVTGCKRVYRAICGLGMVWGLGVTVVEEFWLCVFGLLWLRV